MFDALAAWMNTATGLAQTAGEEAKSVMRAQADRMVAEMDLVRRGEIEALEARIAALEAALAVAVTPKTAQAAAKSKSEPKTTAKAKTKSKSIKTASPKAGKPLRKSATQR
jgi:BMFP domain-containing protein YqiC